MLKQYILQDLTCKNYSNRTRKNELYEELLEKYEEKYSDANRKRLVKKINSVRTNIREELKLINNSAKTGASTDKGLEPMLWYFEGMKFLIDLEELSKS